MWQTEAGITPQMCTAHREPRYSSITTIGTTFHIQHRSIQTKSRPHPTPQPKNSKLPRHNVPHPIPKHTDKSQHRITHHNPRTLKKKPEGCAEGPWLYGPFAVFHSFPKQKKQALCQESKNKIKNKTKNKTKNQSHNK